MESEQTGRDGVKPKSHGLICMLKVTLNAKNKQEGNINAFTGIMSESQCRIRD